MPSESHPLRYNIRWIEHTFSSRAVTESLLNPERESGNISLNDYENATQFFPGPHRYYRVAGSLLGLPLLFAFRKPAWSNARSYFFLTTTSFAGFVVGHLMSISAHFRFVRSIENPDGFSQALENIQHSSGSFPFPGPTIVRQGGGWTVDRDTASTETNRDMTPPSTPQTDSAHPVKSKWDQIRAANSRASTNSTWDALRQNHERARISSSSGEALQMSDDDNRRAEQAKFDELLEEERHMK